MPLAMAKQNKCQTSMHAANATASVQSQLSTWMTRTAVSMPLDTQTPIVFVLGGPGTGKSTQCQLLDQHFNFRHLSAGQLLREHIALGTEDGKLVAQLIENGKIVPSKVTVTLLRNAMANLGPGRAFLIDGFPRNLENAGAWVATGERECDLVLNFSAPEGILQDRLLRRQQGRSDDNVASIKKRFKTFQESTSEVLAAYSAQGLVEDLDAAQPVDQVQIAVQEVLQRRLPDFMTPRRT